MVFMLIIQPCASSEAYPVDHSFRILTISAFRTALELFGSPYPLPQCSLFVREVLIDLRKEACHRGCPTNCLSFQPQGRLHYQKVSDRKPHLDLLAGLGLKQPFH